MSTEPRPVPMRWFALAAAGAIAATAAVLLLLGAIPNGGDGDSSSGETGPRAALRVVELRQQGFDLRPLTAGRETRGGVLLECGADGRSGWIEAEVRWMERGNPRTRMLSSLLQADQKARLPYSGEPGDYRWRARTVSLTGERGPWLEFGGGERPDFVLLKAESGAGSGSGSGASGGGGSGSSESRVPPAGTKVAASTGDGGGAGRPPLPSLPLQLPSLWQTLTSPWMILAAAAALAAAGLALRKRRRTA